MHPGVKHLYFKKLFQVVNMLTGVQEYILMNKTCVLLCVQAFISKSHYFKILLKKTILL